MNTATTDVKLNARHAIMTIQRRVADAFGFSVLDLLGSRRTKAIAMARSLAMYLARERVVHASLEELGRAFQRHHTTVLSAHQSVRHRLATEPHYAELVADLLEEAGG